MKLTINLELPDSTESVEKKQSVEEKVREAISAVESGYESRQEWKMLRGLHQSLKSLKRPNERAQNLLDMIEPVLRKYGYQQ